MVPILELSYFVHGCIHVHHYCSRIKRCKEDTVVVLSSATSFFFFLMLHHRAVVLYHWPNLSYTLLLTGEDLTSLFKKSRGCNLCWCWIVVCSISHAMHSVSLLNFPDMPTHETVTLQY